jgi:hypothetical protein
LKFSRLKPSLIQWARRMLQQHSWNQVNRAK